MGTCLGPVRYSSTYLLHGEPTAFRVSTEAAVRPETLNCTYRLIIDRTDDIMHSPIMIKFIQKSMANQVNFGDHLPPMTYTLLRPGIWPEISNRLPLDAMAKPDKNNRL
jgi:hypothetical protein